MNTVPCRILAGFAFALFSSLAAAQLVVAPIDGTTVTADTMAASLLGSNSGIVINSANYTGANGASGTFTGGAGIINIGSGILLTSGSVNNVVGPNNDSGASTSNGLAGDADLTTLAGVSTADASVLMIDFVPSGNQIQFSYVFGSEEYNEYVNEFNDAFGFLVNGTNYALIPGTSTPVTINNVNCGVAASGVAPSGPGVNCNLFVNNDPASHNTQLDGYTKVLTFTAPVNAGVSNTLKIAIADASDFALDSAVFIAGGSLSVCGGPNQPPCGGTGGNGQGNTVVAPMLSTWMLCLLAALAVLFGTYALRSRSW
jgi:hypothetical protein